MFVFNVFKAIATIQIIRTFSLSAPQPSVYLAHRRIGAKVKDRVVAPSSLKLTPSKPW